MPRTAYMVPGGDTGLGWCRVCTSSEGCDHLPDQQYRAGVTAIIRKMDLAEVSLVSKPAHPEARIADMSVDTADLQDALGPKFRPGMPVSCDKCLQKCPGLFRPDLPHG